MVYGILWRIHHRSGHRPPRQPRLWQQRPVGGNECDGRYRYSDLCCDAGLDHDAIRHLDEIVPRRLAQRYGGRDSGRVFGLRIFVRSELELWLHVVRQPEEHALREDDQERDPDAAPQDGQRLRQREDSVSLRHFKHQRQRHTEHLRQLRRNRHHWS